MALRKLYIGSVGPFLYDDADPIDDPDGDFAGEDYKGLVTNGQMLVEAPPTQDNEVIRQIDIDHRIVIPVSVIDISNPVELNLIPGTNGTISIAYQVIGAATQDEYTIYAYDENGPAANPPTIVDAFGAANERWIAIGGKYNITIADHGDLNGLADDDHTQYYNQVRGDARYSLLSHAHDKISEGNSDVEVIDTGVGEIKNRVDGTERTKLTSTLLKVDVPVALGHTSASSLLHIRGSGGPTKGIYLYSTGTGTPCVYIYPGAASSDAGFITFGDGTGWKFYIAKRSDSGATKFVIIKDDGKVSIGNGAVNPTSSLQVTGLPIYANNAAAVTGGLTIGAFYRTGGDPDPVCVVH
jgi:hypothetical protein